MIHSGEAANIILSQPFGHRTELISVHHSLGRILAENILADQDLPPFDRVMMDGVAMQWSDFENGKKIYKIVGLQKAGEPQKHLEGEGNCLEVMTGAVCPHGADAVIPYEQIEISEGICKINIDSTKRWMNIHPKASDKKQHDILIPAKRLISPTEIGILASVGKSEVLVAAHPRIHIFSTGDELVEIEDIPQAHQIRRSNVFALQQLILAQGIASSQSHLPDEHDHIHAAIQKALGECDVIILTGGVSKGKFDLIPEVLAELQVEKLFHRIAQRPGKPMWFGKQNHVVVFAFPGNPVSTFMCAVRYLLPWLRASLDQEHVPVLRAKLSSDFENKTEMTHFVQVKITLDEDACLQAEPVTGKGSGDYANLINVDGFLEIPAVKRNYLKGEVFPYYAFRSIC